MILDMMKTTTEHVHVDVHELVNLIEQSQVPEHIHGLIDLQCDPAFPPSDGLQTIIDTAVRKATHAFNTVSRVLTSVHDDELRDILMDAVEGEISRRNLLDFMIENGTMPDVPAPTFNPLAAPKFMEFGSANPVKRTATFEYDTPLNLDAMPVITSDVDEPAVLGAGVGRRDPLTPRTERELAGAERLLDALFGNGGAVPVGFDGPFGR